MKPFTALAAIIFALIALVHLFRLIWGFEVVVGGTMLPQWVSLPGAIIAAVLALMLWGESRR